MRKKINSIITCLIAVALVFSMGTFDVFALTLEKHDTDKFNINDYEQYTIELSNRKTREKVNTIDDVVQYVESLGLADNGFEHIEDACIAELNQYKEDGIELENYTVLIPKVRAKSYYDTYLGNKFYYEYTSVSNLRRETNGTKKSSSNASKWNNWILGVTDLAMNFIDAKWAIPYTMIRSITGVSGTAAVYNGSRNQYVEQFTNTKTRSIYKKQGNSYKLCYQDQNSTLRVKLYFCPVGTAFSSDYIAIGTTYTGDVKANKLSKQEVLKMANTYANHNSKVVFTVSSHKVTETWK